MEINFDTQHNPTTPESEELDGPAASSNHDEFAYIPSAADVTLPYIRLAQGLTPEVAAGNARPGQWILPDGQLADTITAVIVGMRKTRMLRADSDIVCRSSDAITGNGNPGGSCEACVFADWSGPKEKRIPPACTLAYQYLAEYGDEESGGIGVISMSTRSASKVAAQVNLYIRMHGARNTRITLGSTLVVKGSRKFHAPTLIKAGGVQNLLPAATDGMEGGSPGN